MTRFAAQAPQIGSFMSDAPEYAKLTSAGQKTRSEERANLAAETANIHGAGLTANAKVEAAEYGGQAMMAGARADAASSIANGWSSFAGGLAGGVSKIDFGGGGVPGVDAQPTYTEAVADASEYDFGTDAGYGGDWTGGGSPSIDWYE